MADDKNVVDFEQYMKKIRELEAELNKQREAAEQRAKQTRGPGDQGEAFKKLMEAYQAFLPSKDELSGMMGQLAEAFQQAADQARAAQESMAKESDDKGEE